MLAQLGLPDMRLPIQYALTYPQRLPCGAERLSLAQVGSMSFFAPDDSAFPALRLARQAAARGGNAGAVLNGANEYAVGDRKAMEAGGGAYLNFIKIVLRKK